MGALISINTNTYSLAYVYREIDLPLLPVLIEMETEGVLIDKERLLSLDSKIIEEINSQLTTLHEIYGQEFNPNSPIQAAKFIYDYLGVSEGKMGRSVDQKVLESYRSKYYGVEVFVTYKKLVKLYGTYIKSIPKHLDSNDRLHTHFNNVRVETGRLSSSDPINLQNIPIRTLPGTPELIIPFAKEIRKAFIARPGWKIVKFDQSQVEYRILVCFCNEVNTILAIRDGRDIHSDTVAKYLGLPYEVFDARVKGKEREAKNLREAFKTGVYGTIYGASAPSMSEQLGAMGIYLPVDQAIRIQSFIHQSKPAIGKWIQEVKDSVYELGYAETYYSRRMYYPEAKWDSDAPKWMREKKLREAVNGRIQGTSADIMKKAMRGIWDEKERLKMKARQILAVHDEAVYECPEYEVGTLCRIISEIAPNIVHWQIPLDIEIKVGNNWGDTK